MSNTSQDKMVTLFISCENPLIHISLSQSSIYMIPLLLSLQ